MRKNARDYTGHKYSFLTVTRRSEHTDRHGRHLWEVRCQCGNTRLMDIRDLMRREKAGLPASCGCQKKKLISAAKTKHGMSKHPAFAVWRSMVARCTNPKHRAWKNYGGRGITVCPAWMETFEQFWEDMGPTYKPGLELDRKDNDKGYSPENCRWVTRRVNSQNKRGARIVELNGRRTSLSDLSAQTGIRYTTLIYRIDHGCPSEFLLMRPDVRNRFSTSSTRGQDTSMSFSGTTDR